MKKMCSLYVVGMGIILLSSNAYAKRTYREGFTFGTSFSHYDIEQPSLISGGEGNTSTGKSVTNVAKPYVGYAPTEFLSIGINGTFNNIEGEESLKGMSGETIMGERKSSMSGGGLFARFLFAEIMYFEGSIGYYDRRTTMNTKYVTYQDKTMFTGREEEFKVRSIGMGYRVGAGAEIPVAYGFFFTTAYTVNVFQLEPVEVSFDNSDRKLTGKENTHEIEFGLSYYYR